MADTINLEASQKIVSVQGLDHYHEKAMAEIDEKINSGSVGKAGTGENAEIFNTDNLASGNCSHAEGDSTIAAGIAAHAEGYSTSANKDYSHSEGYMAVASGISSHAEGYKTRAMGDYSHAEGNHCSAHGVASHAGGSESVATGDNSFTHGDTVKANNNNEIAFGAFNASNADTLFSVGNGTSDTDRSNAFEVTKTTGKLFNKEIATKEEIEAHAADADIHVTADEKAYWNTLSGKNELDNPGFRVNQRGLSEYSTGYTVDRWYISTDKCKAAPESDGIRLTATATLTSNTHAFWQNIEFPLAPGKYTLSLNVSEVSGVWSARIRTVNASGDYVDSYYTSVLREGVNKVSVDLPEGEYISAVSIGFNKGTEAGNSLKLAWAKLESGSLATPFVQPDYAAELAKCQRFYQVRTTNDIDPLDLRPSMRTITDIKAVEGGYAYVAEL